MITRMRLVCEFNYVFCFNEFSGGTRRVVLQLPDGSFVVTEVDEEQFKALNMQT